MAESAFVDLANVKVRVEELEVAAFKTLTASPRFSMWSKAYSLI